MDLKRLALPTDIRTALIAAPKVPARYEHTDDTTLLQPDFTALYAPDPGDSDDEQWQALTPRLAYLLHTGAKVGADVFCDLVDFDGDSCRLPPAVWRHLERIGSGDAEAWLTTFVATMRMVATRLAIGEVPYPRTTAEEMALHLAISQARDWLDSLEDGLDDLNIAVFGGPADATDDDYQGLDLLGDVLFEDDDVMMLFRPSFDGVEDPESDLSQALGCANLHPSAWFEPFHDSHVPPAFGPAVCQTPVAADIDPDSDESVRAAAQHWLDTVIGAGVAGAVEGDEDCMWVSVDGVSSSRLVEVLVELFDDGYKVCGQTFTDNGLGSGENRRFYNADDLSSYQLSA